MLLDLGTCRQGRVGSTDPSHHPKAFPSRALFGAQLGPFVEFPNFWRFFSRENHENHQMDWDFPFPNLMIGFTRGEEVLFLLLVT